MIYRDDVAVDQNWAKLYIGFDEILCSKYPLKDKLTKAAVRRVGSKRVVAWTRGIYEAEDTVLEMDLMAWVRFIAALGATEGNGVLVGADAAEFELLETITDPGGLAGDLANVATGCTVVGFEKTIENTEAPTMVSVTVKIKEIIWGQTSRGGAGISLAR